MSLIDKSIDKLEAELKHLGSPVDIDAGVRILNYLHSMALVDVHQTSLGCSWILYYLTKQAQLYTILELCRAFDRIFKEHLDGG